MGVVSTDGADLPHIYFNALDGEFPVFPSLKSLSESGSGQSERERTDRAESEEKERERKSGLTERRVSRKSASGRVDYNFEASALRSSAPF